MWENRRWNQGFKDRNQRKGGRRDNYLLIVREWARELGEETKRKRSPKVLRENPHPQKMRDPRLGDYKIKNLYYNLI
jgi:hypothetical protein